MSIASAGTARLAMLPARIATLDVPASSPKAVSSRQPFRIRRNHLAVYQRVAPDEFRHELDCEGGCRARRER